MFDSRHESYQENLETAQKIGDLVGKSAEMKAKINEHNDYIANIAKKSRCTRQKSLIWYFPRR